jgi:hypothetical protein
VRIADDHDRENSHGNGTHSERVARLERRAPAVLQLAGRSAGGRPTAVAVCSGQCGVDKTAGGGIDISAFHSGAIDICRYR